MGSFLKDKSNWPFAAGVVLLLVALAGIVGDEGGKQVKPKTAVVKTKVDGKDKNRLRDQTVTVPKKVVKQVAPKLEDSLHRARISTNTLEKIQRAEKFNRIVNKPLATAGATQSIPGCVTRFVVNQSSRRGVLPRQHWLHYTVSRNIPGWADVNAIVALFNRPGFQASSHFVIDAEGNCAYIVPIENKAWTQAGANSFAVSYEIINTGSEGRYLDSAGYDKLRSVMKIVSARTGIPMQRGAVVNCTPSRPGIVHHFDGGACSGGHHDINPYSISAVVAIVTSGAPAQPKMIDALTKPERKIVNRRCYHFRKRFQAPKGSAEEHKHYLYSRMWQRNALIQKGRLDEAHRRGQKWTQDNIGTRRRAMAYAEHFEKSHRRKLCA